MSLSPQFLRNASDEHLLAALHAVSNDLTTTDAERALAERLANALDENADYADVHPVWDEIDESRKGLLTADGAADALDDVLLFCGEGGWTLRQVADWLVAVPPLSAPAINPLI